MLLLAQLQGTHLSTACMVFSLRMLFHCVLKFPLEGSELVQDLQCLQLSIQFEVERAHQIYKRQSDSHCVPQSFKIANLVKLKTSNLKPVGHKCRKLKDYFAGPFRILAAKSPVSFVLDLS